MATAVEHYENHLAPVYSWMVGDFAEACRAGLQYLALIGLAAPASGTAVDLGCGHGVYAVPLVQLGFDVLAIDSSSYLLTELSGHLPDDRITIVEDDLRNFSSHLVNDTQLIACMGDTITHLESFSDVESLVRKIRARLVSGGTFCVSFRDYASSALTGSDRFIPVRSDADRIHTCFLEYDETTVRVHDLLSTRNQDHWETRVSAYPKLRLAPERLIEFARTAGLALRHQTLQRGMTYLAFEA